LLVTLVSLFLAALPTDALADEPIEIEGEGSAEPSPPPPPPPPAEVVPVPETEFAQPSISPPPPPPVAQEPSRSGGGFVSSRRGRPAPMRRLEPEDVQHQVSITFSPIHLIQPIVELTGEYRLGDQLGVAAILGGGSVKSATNATLKGYALELGTQLRFYALGSFIHGMELGAELLFAYVGATAGSGNSSISGTGAGLSVGPFVGYKIASNVGFTFDIQLGVAYALINASATDGNQSVSQSASNFGPLLNINFGWSF